MRVCGGSKRTGPPPTHFRAVLILNGPLSRRTRQDIMLRVHRAPASRIWEAERRGTNSPSPPHFRPHPPLPHSFLSSSASLYYTEPLREKFFGCDVASTWCALNAKAAHWAARRLSADVKVTTTQKGAASLLSLNGTCGGQSSRHVGAGEGRGPTKALVVFKGRIMYVGGRRWCGACAPRCGP